MTQETCCGFILNHLVLRFDLPVHIAADYQLRKATTDQVGPFREFLSSLVGLTPYRELSEFSYERSHARVDENNPDYYSMRPLERDRWKYYVITWEPAESSDTNFAELDLASNLSPIE